MLDNPLNAPDKSKFHHGIKVTTSTGKPVSDFTMRVEYYNPYVDKKTGEVKPGKWTYRGWEEKREHAKVKIICDTELDALLYTLHQLQHKFRRVQIFDNRIPGTLNAIIWEIIEGVANKEREKIRDYPLMIRNLIPQYRIIPHQKKAA